MEFVIISAALFAAALAGLALLGKILASLRRLEAALGALDDEQQSQAAQAAARSLLRRYAQLSAREGRAKLSQALARRGFSWEAVRAAVDAVWEADEWDE